MLDGRMMQFPLTLTHFVRRMVELYPESEVVTRRPDKTYHRHTYRHVAARAAQLAHALTRLGVKPGARVATLCWNDTAHLEAYLAVPSMGAVVHTLNLRLHPNELGYIARHAEDDVLIVDRSLFGLFSKFRDQVPSLRHVIVVGDDGPVAEEQGLDYERLIAAERPDFAWPDVAENSAAMICYTSGTTGNPKGVVYSHRSCVMHTLVACMADVLGIATNDVVLPVVPMFHAAAWGLPYCAVLTGAKLMLPGPHLDPGSLLEEMQQERVTIAAGVPTIWLGMLAMLDAEPGRYDLKALHSMIIGGAAAPASMIDGFSKRHGLTVIHAWGMTETNPLGSIARVKPRAAARTEAERLSLRASQGFAAPFVEMRHVSEEGVVMPRDGSTMGELEVRGPYVASSYFGGEGPDRFTKDGWFKTGDVVTIDAEGYMRITDRSKDVIKSGGEWISSVALENSLMSHPAVLEAAVFAGRHPKWDERPLAAIVLKPNHSATQEQLIAHLEPHFPKFWMPDAVIFMAQIPRTSTGKFLKSKLRAEHGELLMPTKT